MTVVIDGNKMVRQRDDAVALLERWCGLFFGRDGDGSHITSEIYVHRHTKLFMETADWLKANPRPETRIERETGDRK
jgi:hypothetical protein